MGFLVKKVTLTYLLTYHGRGLLSRSFSLPFRLSLLKPGPPPEKLPPLPLTPERPPPAVPSSSKFSGDYIADFPPRHVREMRLVLRDVIGTGPIEAPSGQVRFTASRLVSTPLTSITHLVSYDGSTPRR